MTFYDPGFSINLIGFNQDDTTTSRKICIMINDGIDHKNEERQNFVKVFVIFAMS